jgi:hypothetical protein
VSRLASARIERIDTTAPRALRMSAIEEQL